MKWWKLFRTEGGERYWFGGERTEEEKDDHRRREKINIILRHVGIRHNFVNILVVVLVLFIILLFFFLVILNFIVLNGNRFLSSQ